MTVGTNEKIEENMRTERWSPERVNVHYESFEWHFYISIPISIAEWISYRFMFAKAQVQTASIHHTLIIKFEAWHNNAESVAYRTNRLWLHWVWYWVRCACNTQNIRPTKSEWNSYSNKGAKQQPCDIHSLLECIRIDWIGFCSVFVNYKLKQTKNWGKIRAIDKTSFARSNRLTSPCAFERGKWMLITISSI